MTACACMGPMYDEPFCYCEMRAQGLPLNQKARLERSKALDIVMRDLFSKRAPEVDEAGSKRGDMVDMVLEEMDIQAEEDKELQDVTRHLCSLVSMHMDGLVGFEVTIQVRRLNDEEVGTEDGS